VQKRAGHGHMDGLAGQGGGTGNFLNRI